MNELEETLNIFSKGHDFEHKTFEKIYVNSTDEAMNIIYNIVNNKNSLPLLDKFNICEDNFNLYLKNIEDDVKSEIEDIKVIDSLLFGNKRLIGELDCFTVDGAPQSGNSILFINVVFTKNNNTKYRLILSETFKDNFLLTIFKVKISFKN